MKTQYVTEKITRTTISIEDGPIVELRDRVWKPSIQVAGMVAEFTHGDRTRFHFWGQSINKTGKPGKVRMHGEYTIKDGDPFPDWIQVILDNLWKGGDNVDL